MEEWADVEESRPHWAARLEDVVLSRVARLLRRRHWVARVEPYPGYGSAGWVRILARAVLAPPGTRSDEVAERDQPQRTVRGWRSFLVAQVPSAVVEVTVAGRTHRVTTDRGGYLDTVVEADLEPGWHDVALRIDGETVSAPVLVIGPEPGPAVLTDVDDTIVVTALPRPLLAAWNAFVLHEHARREVTGMPELFSRWQQAHPGAPTFYLSTGAWNVAAALRRFQQRHGYPVGPLLLTDWGPTNTGWFRSGQQHKRDAIRRLMRELPQLTWVLVGDDGQHDPQIYAEAVAENPGRISLVAIRQLTVAEQVLSHGLPTPMPQHDPAGGPLVVHGHDGHELVLRLLDAGVLSAAR